MLVPQGWQMAGGMLRFNPAMERLSAQNVEVKIDFAVKKDAAGTAMVRWCPTIKYCDSRWLAGGMFGMYQPGSNYNGMVVWPVMPAVQFAVQMLFPWAHPQAQGAQLLDQAPAAELLQKHQRQAQQYGLPFQYDAASATYTYQEGGVQYKEQATVLIEDMGQLGAGMWSNKETYYLRAPAHEFDTWLPVLTLIFQSIQANPAWVVQEQQAQAILTHSVQEAQQAERYRAQKALETQQYLQQAGRDIVEHRQQTFAEIRNDNYLTMTNQEEYVNPITGAVDLGSNQWNHRWVNPNGDVFYANDEGNNPNHLDGGVLNRSDWQRTPVRTRGPQT